MAIPPWTIEMLRRGISDVARKASEPETLEKLKTQAGEILHDLPQTAARGLDAVMRTAESGKRSVQRWTRKHTTLAVPMLNATGTLVTDAGTGVPLADEVLEIGRELFSGDTVGGKDLRVKLQRRIEKCLPGSGVHSVAVAHCFDAALVALTLLGNDRTLVIHRSHAVTMPCGRPLPNLLNDLLKDANPNAKVLEVGGSNRVEASDFSNLNRFMAILADGGDRAVELFDFKDRDALQAVVLPLASLYSTEHSQIPSAEAMLAAGADLVVMPGSGLVGGPPCGLILGRREVVEKLRSLDAFKWLAATDPIIGMMTVAFESSTSSGAQSPVLPIHRLMTTSQENLRGRAERMATRLSGLDEIAQCQVTASDARLTLDGRWRLPSRQIRLRHKSRSATAWSDDLRQDVPAIFAAVEGEDFVIDLRWIAAADDGKLAEALGGHAGETSTGPLSDEVGSQGHETQGHETQGHETQGHETQAT